jgi:hypothetical protein
MEIIDLNDMNELPLNILSFINNGNIELNINFDDTECKKQVNLFLHNNQNIKNYYLMENYIISIDLIDYDNMIYLWLIDCIQIAASKINSSKYIGLFENILKWNISVCDNIMFNFPFTLSDIIYLPISFIKLCYSSNDSNKFINTLIHEKIHLGQRKKELEWEKFINSNSKNWIKIKSNQDIFNLINQFINNKYIDTNYCFISNPDTFYSDFIYIYFEENKYYYGQYMFNKITQHIEKKYFQFDINNKIFEHTTIELEQEHPYEIYAYKIADELVK